MKPRCPLRTDMLDHSAECDPECAWLVRVVSIECSPYDRKVCAMAALAMGTNYQTVEPVNVKEVDDE